MLEDHTWANLKEPERRWSRPRFARRLGGDWAGSREAPDPNDASRLAGCSRLVPPPPRAPRVAAAWPPCKLSTRHDEKVGRQESRHYSIPWLPFQRAKLQRQV